jgi:hypothetical protein
MIFLTSWFVKKGFNNRRRNKRTDIEGQSTGTENKITEKGTMGQLKGLGDRERRMGNKEQRLKIWERGRETRNRDVRLGTEDMRQGTEM